MTGAPEREEDFRHFVEVHWLGLVRSAYLLLGDPDAAEELVEQTLAKVHHHWDRRVRDGAPMAYVRRTLVNEAISAARRRWVRQTLLGGLSDPGADSSHALLHTDPRDDHRGADERDLLLRALQDLPPRMRAVVVLRYFDDLNEAATAEVLGISVGSARSHASRGLHRLRTVVRVAKTEETS